MFNFLKHIYQNLQLTRFNELAAERIDTIYKRNVSSTAARVKQAIESRLTYAFAFIPATVIDLTTSLFLSASYFIASLFVFDGLKDQFLTKSKSYGTTFTKNLIALIFSPFGLLDPRLIAFNFLPNRSKPGVVVSGSKLYSSGYIREEKPETIEQVQRIIQNANENADCIILVGGGYSQGEQFIPKNNGKPKNKILLNLENLNSIQIDADQKSAIVKGNVKHIDLQLEANKHKLAMQVMQASNIFSIFGSFGTNIHGWNVEGGTINNTIISLTLITPEGKILTIDKSSPLFGAVVGGYGLVGVIVEAKIKLIPNEKLIEQTKVVPLKDYATYFKQDVLPKPEIRMHLYRLPLDLNWENGYVANYKLEKADQLPVQSENLSREPQGGTFFNSFMFNILRRFKALREFYSKKELNDLVATESFTTTNKAMQPPVNPLFTPAVSEAAWLQEYFLPGDKLVEFLNKFNEILVKNKVALVNATVRFVKKDDSSILNYAPEDRYALVICWHQSLTLNEIAKAKQWIKESYDLVEECKGAYYLPYQGFATREQFLKAYPDSDKLLKIKKELDPNEVFNTGFYQDYIEEPKLDDKKSSLLKIINNEKLYKEFSFFFEKILRRVGSQEFYALLEDILRCNSNPDDLYSEIQNRLPEIMPSMFGLLARDLSALADIKKELGAQLKVLLDEEGFKTIRGMLEIGYPGRFLDGIKKHFKVTGKTIVLHEEQSLLDVIQSGFPLPDDFVKLDYKKPNLDSIESDSEDLITCFVGLHHFTETQLDQFIKSLVRILRSGGAFVIVDHDVVNEHVMTMADGAHTVFNVVSGVSPEAEKNEVRNFKSIEEWRKILATYGLIMQEELGPQMIRENDPTCNRMVGFINQKPPVNNLTPRSPCNVFANDALFKNSNPVSDSNDAVYRQSSNKVSCRSTI